MSIFDDALGIIEDGLNDKNIGIPLEKCPGLTEFTYGTRKGTYILIGAETGVGKTKFARDQFMFAPYDYYKKMNDPSKLDVHFIDFSLEITAKENMINAIIRKIYKDTGRSIPYRKVMGFSKDFRLTNEEQILIKSYRKYFEEYEKKLTVIDGAVTATKFHDTLLTHFRKHGKFSKDDGSMSISKLGMYTPNNAQLLTVGIVDTINLADNEQGQVNKQSIDRISKIALIFRNVCNFTPVVIQQFNADNSDIQRQRHGIKTPMLRDFEDSKRTTKDANLIIGLWDPTRYQQQTMKFGKTVLDVGQLRTWLVSAHVLKNRNGTTNKRFPLRFLGAVSMFEEFPSDMGPMEYANLTKY